MLVDKPQGIEGCNALLDLYKYAKGFGYSTYIIVDLALARGLDYYTGPVFEVLARGYEDHGSIAGGGRYDELVEVFGGDPTSATGVSFGIDRLVPILEKKGVFDKIKLGNEVYVAPVNQDVKMRAIEVTQMIRRAGISALTDMMDRSLGKQFEYADKKEIAYVVIIGPKELEEDSVTIRDMKTGEQKLVKINRIISFLKDTH